ncbi:MAG: hypothetical protein H0U52_11395 [Chloroflexi bacterium]|nr:hypothetical protein [Chloroflexota bacterium]
MATADRTLDLKLILEAESRAQAAVVLPISGRTVGISTFFRREERAGEAIPRASSCWAPNKPALLFEGEVAFAEFVLVRLLERAGWEARWIKNWTGGREFCVDVDRPRDLPAGPSKVFTDLHRRASILRGAGSWDIFAWSESDYLFLESKQYRSSDKLNRNQVVWLEAALDEGFTPNQFAIVEYDAGRPTPPQLVRQASAKPAAGSKVGQLGQLLSLVQQADRTVRIESRNEVAAFGSAAIGPMVDWLHSAELRRFAVAVLERMGSSEPKAFGALKAFAASGEADAHLAIDAVARLSGSRSAAARTSGRIADTAECASGGHPPPAQGPCGMPNRDGSACQNPGRWPIGDVWSCTTHCFAFSRSGGSR